MKKKVSPAIHRAHVFYSGRVQGIGFRYTSEALAHKAGVAGFVKNLPDGRVELVCEGAKGKIEEFLRQIQDSSLGRYIQKTDCRWEDPTHAFTDFSVEFHF
jgi:acylphosphatase